MIKDKKNILLLLLPLSAYATDISVASSDDVVENVVCRKIYRGSEQDCAETFLEQKEKSPRYTLKEEVLLEKLFGQSMLPVQEEVIPIKESVSPIIEQEVVENIVVMPSEPSSVQDRLETFLQKKEKKQRYTLEEEVLLEKLFGQSLPPVQEEGIPIKEAIPTIIQQDEVENPPVIQQEVAGSPVVMSSESSVIQSEHKMYTMAAVQVWLSANPFACLGMACIGGLALASILSTLYTKYGKQWKKHYKHFMVICKKKIYGNTLLLN